MTVLAVAAAVLPMAQIRRAVQIRPCDVMLSVHPDFSHLFEKHARAVNGDAGAFVDPQGCREYAESMLALLDRRLASE